MELQMDTTHCLKIYNIESLLQITIGTKPSVKVLITQWPKSNWTAIKTNKIPTTNISHTPETSVVCGIMCVTCSLPVIANKLPGCSMLQHEWYLSLRQPYRLLQGLQNKSYHKSAPARETWDYQNFMLQLKVGNVGLELHGPMLHFTDRN